MALDRGAKWIGGRYYLHHLVRCVRSQPELADLRFCDVWWGGADGGEAFGEIGDLIDESIVIRLPHHWAARGLRFIRRSLTRSKGAGDLFRKHNVAVLFPVPPCEDPGVPYLFWLPDFQYLHFPELFGRELIDFYQAYYAKHVRAARAVVLSSEHAAQDFRRVFPQFVEKAKVVRFCSVPTAEWWWKDPDSVGREYGLPQRFFVLSNQFSHHKNHGVVFEAVRLLQERGVDITLACTGSTFGYRGQDYFENLRTYIERHRLEGSIRILGLLPRSDQIALLRGAVALVQPSRFEGWSTVIEDARSLGKRILASDIPVHVEQLRGEATPLLGLDDPEAWADALDAAQRNEGVAVDRRKAELKGSDALKSRMKQCARDFGDALALAAS